MPAKTKKAQIATYTHPADTRRNIPTAEVEPAMDKDKRKSITLEYERSSRNTDLDPQLVWRGKDEQDQTDLVVTAPPIFIQEKVHPRVLIEDLLRQSSKERDSEAEQLDLFSDFNGLEDQDLKSDYYEHEQNWSNRMILGDSLQVMASLASREGYQGKVQCIYIDPPYGIRFNSNFQWSTTSRDVRDGNAAHITREPEQVRAFRDTWRDGIHSYLTYLRDRLTVARDLLADSGSIFVQVGDENVHRIRSLMDEVFGDGNFFSMITLKKLSPLGTSGMANVTDYVLWYAKSKPSIKFRPIFDTKPKGSESRYDYVQLPSGERRKLTKQEIENLEGLPGSWKIYCPQGMLSSGYTPTCTFDFVFQGSMIKRNRKSWRTNLNGMETLIKADRLVLHGTLPYLVAFHEDNPLSTMNNIWTDSGSASTSYEKIYVVQTSTRQVQKCILMATDPGDLVLDPTCGSGTTAYVSEQWGRRWITIDTSRVALTLARARMMGARYPHYILADNRDGQLKAAELSRRDPSEMPTYGNVRQGFVYDRVPYITLRAIANNAEIDVIWDEYQEKLDPLRDELNLARGTEWEEWENPRDADESWPAETQELHRQWWELRIARQKEIDASIAARAEYKYLYDKPHEDRSKVRVAGPFTVESLSPHRLLVSGDLEEPRTTPTDTLSKNGQQYEGTAPDRDFASMIIENLRTSGVQ